MLFRSYLLGLVGTAICSLGLVAPTVAAPTSAGSRVLVDRDGTYMRATRLSADNSILGAYAAGEGNNRVIRSVRSRDGGKTWTRLGVVASAPSATTDLDNAYPLQLPGGRLLVAFRNHDKTSSGGFTWYRLTLCYSDDLGQTWHFLTHILERAASGLNGLWEPLLRVADNGNLQAYYSSETSPTDQDNLVRTSTDGGKTWSNTRTVSGAGITSRDGMIGVAKMPNGNLICVFENTEGGKPFSISSVESSDDGQTWGNRKRIYTAPNNKEAGAPAVMNVGGTLVVSFMTTEAGGGPGVDGGQMRVVTSTNNGGSWSGSTVIGALGSHWPSLYTLDNTNFLALFALSGTGLVSQQWRL